MKIAILTPTFSHFSGIDRVVELQSEEFAKRGDNVDIFTLSATIKPKSAGLVILGMPKNPILERIYRLFMFLDIKKTKKFSKILEDYNMVISHFYPMNILAYKAKKSNHKLIYIYHNAGVASTEGFSIFEKAYLKIFNSLNNYTIRNCDKTISISKFLRDILKEETGKDGEVKYINIDRIKFHKGIDGSKIRKKYDANGPLFFYVGRISPHKGIHLLIESFKLVEKKYPDAKLIIAGKHTFPNYSKKLKLISADDRNIIFAGFIPDEDMPHYYSAADVYTTASLWEGFDMPIVEAAACGTPSVAFDVAAHPEVIEIGELVKVNDIHAFSEAMIRVYERFNKQKTKFKTKKV